MTPHNTDTDDVSRRTILKNTLGLTIAGLTPLATTDEVAASSTDDGHSIPAPFDQMPRIENPNEREREHVWYLLPPWAIPDEGPIPDYTHTRTVEREITVPEWGLAATYWRLQHGDPEEVEPIDIDGMLMEYAYVRERFVTPDGRDAVEAIQAALEASENPGDLTHDG